MGIDIESTSWVGAILTVMGIGGGGGILKVHTTQSNHEARINQLEEDKKTHGEKIDATHTTVTRLDERTATTDDNVKSILDWVRGRD